MTPAETPDAPDDPSPGADPVADVPVHGVPGTGDPVAAARRPPAPTPGQPHLTRREARTRALELLYAADVRETSVARLMADVAWVDDFTRLLLDTVVAYLPQLDEVIGSHAEGWTVDRMPAVDRSVLRLGVAEMLHVDDVPPKVAIDEAVELVKSLSTDASPKFVNGVLAAIARAHGLT